jgi:GNAT superfamily N-acetyltransferase
VIVAQRVRRVRPDDVATVVALVHELAEYERAAESCTLTVEQLRSALFGPSPALFGHVAEVDGPDGPEVVGCALWFLNFSTWRGVHGVYLEDLFVRPGYRGTGLGKALLTALAAVCVERGYARLEWVVLDWNEPSIRFYRSIGAQPIEGWTTFRLDGDALTALGTATDEISAGRPGDPDPSTRPGIAR